MRIKTRPKRARSGLKPFVFPEGFTVIVDTREQKSLFDPCPEKYKERIISKALKFGDYSIAGYEDMFTIERKMISDLYSYCGIERRTKTDRKMSEFKGMIDRGGWVGLIIQATEADVLAGNLYSRLSPEVVRKSIVSFEIKTGIHVYYSRHKKQLRRWVLDRSIYFYNAIKEGKI